MNEVFLFLSEAVNSPPIWFWLLLGLAGLNSTFVVGLFSERFKTKGKFANIAEFLTNSVIWQLCGMGLVYSFVYVADPISDFDYVTPLLIGGLVNMTLHTFTWFVATRKQVHEVQQQGMIAFAIGFAAFMLTLVVGTITMTNSERENVDLIVASEANVNPGDTTATVCVRQLLPIEIGENTFWILDTPDLSEGIVIQETAHNAPLIAKLDSRRNENGKLSRKRNNLVRLSFGSQGSLRILDSQVLRVADWISFFIEQE